MTTSGFRYLDVSSVHPTATPWQKLNTGELSVQFQDYECAVGNMRGRETDFSLEKNGFSVHRAPMSFTKFDDDAAVRTQYYSEVQTVLKRLIPGATKVLAFAHLVRLNSSTAGNDAPAQRMDNVRRPAVELHVDQNARSVRDLVRTMLPAHEVEPRLRGRYMVVNVWKPISYPASDHPLAVVDWRTTQKDDYVDVRLIIPKQQAEMLKKTITRDTWSAGQQQQGEEEQYHDQPLPDGYDQIGVGLLVKPRPQHKLYYQRDMTPEEVLLIKCYDSFGEGEPMGREGIAVRTPHSAFVDPLTPQDAPIRRSIETRCLVLCE